MCQTVLYNFTSIQYFCNIGSSSYSVCDFYILTKDSMQIQQCYVTMQELIHIKKLLSTLLNCSVFMYLTYYTCNTSSFNNIAYMYYNCLKYSFNRLKL